MLSNGSVSLDKTKEHVAQCLNQQLTELSENETIEKELESWTKALAIAKNLRHKQRHETHIIVNGERTKYNTVQ